jgi:hypothetical protein
MTTPAQATRGVAQPTSPVAGDAGAAQAGGPAASRTIRCGFCGGDFAEDRGQPACAACPLATACRSIRCPLCGYENPVTPGWIQRLEKWLNDP